MPIYDLKITGQHAIGDGPNNPTQDVALTCHTDDDHPGDAIADAIRQATSVGGVRVVAITATLREMKTPGEIVDMLSELQTTLREEGPNMDGPEQVYMAGLLRSLRYALGLEDTLSDTWRQARIPAPPPANTEGGD